MLIYYYIYGWIYEKSTNTLHQITHMHFNFTALKGLEISPSDETREAQQNEDDGVEEKKNDMPSNFYRGDFFSTVTHKSRHKFPWNMTGRTRKRQNYERPEILLNSVKLLESN